MGKEQLPIFPITRLPDSIKETQTYVIEDEDIRNDQDFEELVKRMYDNPYATFEFYAQGENQLISKAIKDGRIHSDTVEAYYYKHPKFDRDYLRIKKEAAQFDWEKQVAETSPMFFRQILILTEKQRRIIDREFDVVFLKSKMTWAEKIATHPVVVLIFVLGSIASIVSIIAWMKSN